MHFYWHTLYNCDYFLHTIIRFYLIDFQLNKDFLSQFCVFYRKITYRYAQRPASQENALKRAKTCRFFFFFSFLQHYKLKWFFYCNWKQFQVFKRAKFEFKVIVHYGLLAKCTQLWPLNANKLLESRSMGSGNWSKT